MLPREAVGNVPCAPREHREVVLGRQANELRCDVPLMVAETSSRKALHDEFLGGSGFLAGEWNDAEGHRLEKGVARPLEGGRVDEDPRAPEGSDPASVG